MRRRSPSGREPPLRVAEERARWGLDAGAQMIAKLQDMDITLLWPAFVAFVIATIQKYTIEIRASDEHHEQGLDLTDHGEKILQLLILRPGAAISVRAPTSS